MAAKDYKICPALFKAYIAKTSKRDPHLMTNDRREITENEILYLIDWWLDKECSENVKGMQFNSILREGKRIELRFVNIEQKESEI